MQPFECNPPDEVRVKGDEHVCGGEALLDVQPAVEPATGAGCPGAASDMIALGEIGEQRTLGRANDIGKNMFLDASGGIACLVAVGLAGASPRPPLEGEHKNELDAARIAESNCGSMPHSPELALAECRVACVDGADLCREAHRIAEDLSGGMPRSPEVQGEARRLSLGKIVTRAGAGLILKIAARPVEVAPTS